MKTISIGGMGGFELGMRAAGAEPEPMAFCEAFRTPSITADKRLDKKPFPSSSRKAAKEILRYHFPSAVQFNSPWDIVNSTGYERRSIDIICGKFHHREAPVARAASRVEPKPGGFHAYARLMRALQPRWGLVEFDSGILRADRGRCFQSVLAQLTGWAPTIPADGWRSFGMATPAPGLGDDAFGVSWRVLDLCGQYRVPSTECRVPMQRERLYLVCARGVAVPAEVLLDEEDVVRLPGAIEEPTDAGVDAIVFDGRSGEMNYSPVGSRKFLPTIHGQNVALADPRRRFARWLVPFECEMAFGLPESYTATGRRINAKGSRKVAIRDAPRYKLLGQHTVPPAIIEWIWSRITNYELQITNGKV